LPADFGFNPSCRHFAYDRLELIADLDGILGKRLLLLGQNTGSSAKTNLQRSAVAATMIMRLQIFPYSACRLLHLQVHVV
jgi:hypothetical protein